MMRYVAGSLIALVSMIGLTEPLRAGLISGTLTGGSTLTPTGTPGVFIQNFTGSGNDTLFGSFTASSDSTIDFSTPPNIGISSGSFLETFGGGTLFGTSSGSGTASGTGTAAVTIDLLFTGGTGLFAGDTGNATITGTITTTGPTTESFSGTYSGSLTTVPEPGYLLLLAPAAVIMFRRRSVAVDK
jgi:hypothetical protein